MLVLAINNETNITVPQVRAPRRFDSHLNPGILDSLDPL